MSLFHLIVIIASHVKSHSLQERNVQENALIVDHHIKKSIYIYLLGQLERLYAISHKNKVYVVN